jgi:hypothetical protein
MKQLKLTQADIDANPLLKKIGAVAGQTMEYSFVPSEETGKNEKNKKVTKRDGNGGNHPPGGPGKP